MIKQINTSTGLIIGELQIISFSEKILYADNDGDGIPNKDDPYPDEAFDERFMIVDDYSYEPSIDFVDRHYKNSQQCYGKIPEPNVIGKIIAVLTIATRDSNSCADILEPLLSQTSFDFGKHPEREKDSSALNHAFDAMRHYFWGSGTEVNYSECDTCELISSSTQNLTHLFDNINRTMRCAEGIIKDGQNAIICPKSEQKFKSVCLIKEKADSTTEAIDIVECKIDCDDIGLSHGSSYCNYVHRDWNLTIGESTGTLIAKIERDGEKFTMQYRYYIKDIYEWAYHYDKDPYDISAILHAPHENGTAQEYLMQGHFDGYLSWNLNDKVINRDIMLTLFMTLAEEEGGYECYKWTRSNETDRFEKSVSKGE